MRVHSGTADDVRQYHRHGAGRGRYGQVPLNGKDAESAADRVFGRSAAVLSAEFSEKKAGRFSRKRLTNLHLPYKIRKLKQKALNRTSTRPQPPREPLAWCESGGVNPGKITCEPRTQRAFAPVGSAGCPRYRTVEGPAHAGNESGTAEVFMCLCLSYGRQRLFSS